MNEQSPYEDGLFKGLNELPLPNEDLAWADMKRRLDKKDEGRPFILPCFKSCGGIIFLLLLVIIAYVLIKDPANLFYKKPDTNILEAAGDKNKQPVIKDRVNTIKQLQDSNSRTNPIVYQDFATVKNGPVVNSNTPTKINVHPPGESSSGIRTKIAGANSGIYSGDLKKPVLYKRRTNSTSGNFKRVLVTKRAKGKMTSKVSPKETSVISLKDTLIVNGSDAQSIEIDTKNSIVDQITTSPFKDSLKKKVTDTVASSGNVKTDSSKQKSIYFSAGAGLHQLLPVAGQKSNPYNSAGRKNSLADYIPSAYFRINKKNKWFLQSEFRYAAPQYTKEIIFDQKISDSTGFLKVSNSSVKKTFFHQVPVSFNHFVLPGLSLGAGATFNKFKSAIVQQDVYKRNGITDSLISADIMNKKKADSNFVTSYMQLLLEAQFKFKQLSGGLRYSFGLQPYLKFQLPGGVEREEKNTALQIFIRYELWRSNKKIRR